ncbi:Aste57867_11344 [Aphanomyces stellatus]|uniref:Aste57867_11344 protein n=1 Tax=Aphanomyces stellatus TaxID=120398 RepID=A0A485KT32_9STRA|nr:hypothetical protein As57867_011302 [Aphanomyces stellatus]VFT88206.1 Aste57867_11344 [Aphanomyces stellatus]
MSDAVSLLGLNDHEFAECFAEDPTISEWLFREMKAVLHEVESSDDDDPSNAAAAGNLLLVAVRVVASDDHGVNLAQLVDSGILSLPRIVVMCSLYAQSNADVLQWWMQRVCDRAPTLTYQIPMLHDIFYHSLLSMHHQVASLKSPCIIEATQIQMQLCDLAKTIHALVGSSDAFLPVLTPPHTPSSELGASFDGHTLLHAILVCYEYDLPTLTRLSRNDKVIAKTRRLFLASIFRWIDGVFLSEIRRRPDQADARCEALFGVLNSLLHNADAVEPAALVADLGHWLQFKSKCTVALEDSTVDAARVDYLGMLLSDLPQRMRQTATTVLDDTNPNVVATADDDKAAIANSIVLQVKEIFPDLGDGFLELCIQACEYSSDKVIMSLLEDAVPDAVASIDRTLTKADPRYAALVGMPATPAAVAAPAKADPTQIWVGKKKQADKYKPESVKADPEYAAKQLQLAQTYDQEPAWVAPSAHLDEYNDDYNDEMEEYEPFGVHDDEPTDYEEIIARNKAVRAQEAEDAFWEGIRNPNHKPTATAATDDDEDNDQDGDQDGGETTAQPGGQGGGSRQGRPSQGKKGGAPVRDPNDPDPKKQIINRARKEQNKSSVANHRRKDKALKKQGGGMF